MNKNNIIASVVISIVVLALGFLSIRSFNHSIPIVGSVSLGSEYHATSTLGVAQTHTDVIEAYPGSFGSIVITSPGTGTITVYDAARAIDINATNTIATAVASLPAGTYTIDSVATKGLVFVYNAFAGTATLTYR